MKRREVGEKQVPVATLQDRSHELDQRVLVRGIDTRPARANLRLTRSLDHIGFDALAICVRTRIIQVLHGPAADQRLVQQILVVG